MIGMPPFHEHVVFDTPPHGDHGAATRRSNRRRLLVFSIVFVAILLPGLVWNLLRPAEFLASARVQIAAGSTAARPDLVLPGGGVVDQATAAPADLLTQAQLLTSRPLLEAVLQQLERDGYPLGAAGEDHVATLQKAIAVRPVAGTEIVELQAIGESPELMARIVNTLIATYRDRLFVAHGSASDQAISNLRGEVERLGASIDEKRSQLAAFRTGSGVVSSERSENEALARIKGLSESLNKANEEAAKAEARLRTLQGSAAAGGSPVFSRDNPTLAAIEQRLSATREQLRDMERVYTPAFMAMDPTARALKARQAELERQLASSRSSSQQAALAAAEEDAAGARATVGRLRAQIDGLRREAQVFSGNFQVARAMEDDVIRLEGTRRNALERLEKLGASESARLPGLTLIEAAAVPQKPWRPDYLRDALINLVAAFVLGLLAVWFVELFNRLPTPVAGGPTTVLMPPPWLAPGLPGVAQPVGQLPAGPAVRQLPAAPSLPRELTAGEVAALLAAADDDGRRLCAVLLLGLTADEARALRRCDLDLATGQLSVGSAASGRRLVLPEPLARALARVPGTDPEQALLVNALGQPLAPAELDNRVACAAIDAGLDAGASISPDVLRHTCIAHLLRQNVRFSRLAGLVGQLDSAELAAYAALSDGPRPANGDDADPILPALREASLW